MKRKKTLALAFSGISIAIIVILFFLSSIIEVLDYTVSALAGLIITFILIEFERSYAIGVYLASSILSLLLVPSKITPLLFIAFCGWYPLYKRFCERRKEPLCTFFKFLVFNLDLSLILFLGSKFLLLDSVNYLFFVGIFLLSNLTFFVYDLLITKLIWLYVNKYKSKFKLL